ncbi:MAG TPA: hypothetical protein VNF50_10650, partial [Acidimicrobiales bacterium]|nr:hypothetical protein [Acidimicrobiales bacterium]
GEDLMHSRDYSDETSRVIDEEVGRILREQEERATEYLKRHRAGLDKVASTLLEMETIDGAEVGRLVDEGYGQPVHPEEPEVPHFGTTEATDAGPPAAEGNGNGSTVRDDTAQLDPGVPGSWGTAD